MERGKDVADREAEREAVDKHFEESLKKYKHSPVRSINFGLARVARRLSILLLRAEIEHRWCFGGFRLSTERASPLGVL